MSSLCLLISTRRVGIIIVVLVIIASVFVIVVVLIVGTHVCTQFKHCLHHILIKILLVSSINVILFTLFIIGLHRNVYKRKAVQSVMMHLSITMMRRAVVHTACQEQVMLQVMLLIFRSCCSFFRSCLSPKIGEMTMHSYRNNVGTHVCLYNPFCIRINDGTHYILLVDSGQSMTCSK